MRIGLVSDVHGDVLALTRVLTMLEGLGVGKILCAGDMVGYGPDPDRVVGLLREHEVIVVRGNHDRWAADRGPGRPDPHGGGCINPITHEWLKDVSPLRLLPVSNRLVTLLHGTPGSDLEYMNPETFGPARLAEMLEELATDVLVAGHTHAPMNFRCSAGLVVNPGSVLCVGTVRSSRSFAVLDVDEMDVRHFSAVTGRPIEVAPWISAIEQAS